MNKSHRDILPVENWIWKTLNNLPDEDILVHIKFKVGQHK